MNSLSQHTVGFASLGFRAIPEPTGMVTNPEGICKYYDVLGFEFRNMILLYLLLTMATSNALQATNLKLQQSSFHLLFLVTVIETF